MMMKNIIAVALCGVATAQNVQQGSAEAHGSSGGCGCGSNTCSANSKPEPEPENHGHMHANGEMHYGSHDEHEEHYGEHDDHHGMPDMSRVDPNYDLTNEEFLKMDAEEFWNEALPKLDPSKLQNLITELDQEHLQKMLEGMPGGHPDDHAGHDHGDQHGHMHANGEMHYGDHGDAEEVENQEL